MRALIFSALLAVISGCGGSQSPSLENGEWIDLTHSFDDRSLYWPTTSPFVLSTVSEGMTEQGYYYSAYAFQGSEHGGTHLDAPVHFQAAGQSTDEIPVESLIGPAIVIDVSEKTASERNYGISADDIRDWESEHGQITGQPVVLFNTGSAKLWPDAEAYLGTTRRGPGGVAELSFPGLTPDAADFLAHERNVRAVGIDTPSLDMASSAAFLVYRILFDKNIPGFENVADLSGVPPLGAHVFALPMKIKGGSGGPLRIVALVPD